MTVPRIISYGGVQSTAMPFPDEVEGCDEGGCFT